jgi:hypothetical protein
VAVIAGIEGTLKQNVLSTEALVALLRDIDPKSILGKAVIEVLAVQVNCIALERET